MFSFIFLSISVFAHPPECDGLFRTAEARGYQRRAAAIFAADPHPDEHLAYVGVSRAQWLELLNEGEIHARRWGAVPLRTMPLANRPKLEAFESQNGGVVIHARDARPQLSAATDEAWARTVIELMEARHPKIRTPGFFGFLVQLRIALRETQATSPTLRQIIGATTYGGLPKGPVNRQAEFRTLTDLLDIPWGGRGNTGSVTRQRLATEAFRDLPAEAGVVLSLGEGALRKILWHETGSAESVRIDLDDVVSIEVFTDEDLAIMERL